MLFSMGIQGFRIIENGFRSLYDYSTRYIYRKVLAFFLFLISKQEEPDCALLILHLFETHNHCHQDCIALV